MPLINNMLPRNRLASAGILLYDINSLLLFAEKVH